jgi:hypothetical protein
MGKDIIRAARLAQKLKNLFSIAMSQHGDKCARSFCIAWLNSISLWPLRCFDLEML